jgi:hypothetical protein
MGQLGPQALGAGKLLARCLDISPVHSRAGPRRAGQDHREAPPRSRPGAGRCIVVRPGPGPGSIPRVPSPTSDRSHSPVARISGERAFPMLTASKGRLGPIEVTGKDIRDPPHERRFGPRHAQDRAAHPRQPGGIGGRHPIAVRPGTRGRDARGHAAFPRLRPRRRPARHPGQQRCSLPPSRQAVLYTPVLGRDHQRKSDLVHGGQTK